MTKFSDETLMAYADGELDLVSRAEIEAAMASDPAIARIVLRHQALRTRLQTAYSGVLTEPVPAQLSNLFAPAVAAPAVDLAAPARRSQLPQWSALATAVALGLFAGILMMRDPAGPYAETEAGLVARGDLAIALSSQLARDADAGSVRIGLSYRDRSGAFCRTFRLQQQAPLAGLACRSAEDWQLQLIAAATPLEGELRGAALMPMAVLHAVDASIEGEPFDAPSEIAARDAGWRVTVQPASDQ
ncbi:MAG: hypothetical protein WAW79_08000 [Steroidobacteraceae bacterium]